MTPTASTPATPPPAPASKPRRRRPKKQVLISDVPWETYLRLVKAFERKRNVRLAYDRGELEIMTPSFEHDRDAAVLAHLAELLTEELGLPVIRGGSVTVRQKKIKKGVEPDRCFWITNAAKLAGVRKLDLKIHPPPDLAIEVDVTSSSLDRFGIYAKLGAVELWRLDGDDLRFHVLGAKGRYVESAASKAFPLVTPADLMVFVRQARVVGDDNLVSRDFRNWLRQRIAGQSPPTP